MPTPVLDLRPARYDDPVAARLVAELQQEFVVRYGGPDETPVDPAEFAPPRGTFLVAWDGDEPVGCGGWRIVEPGLGEIKRMYVVAAHRGRGLSRIVLAALEDAARAAGLTRLRLETGDQQPEALRLYGTSGYAPIPRFGYYACHESSLCFAKDL
ncbi:GNAT family N-acetyltransferase [Vallicoccus soli]|uniref:GNAT family N-acetyltransferase n=1 Tax=Vallicoccus soli TaxID=2339232 RepID=A0A3A3YXN8_9ACTN|nr:GNAT family N-acetyltransferase [Vallicoccus soli]RJK92775.1 GNAT family N-acetyltransferase [Vallicoccus soli]